MNVLMYGADASGATYCDSAIQRTIAACAANGTVVDLYFPRGKYKILINIKVPNACTRLAVRGDKSATMCPSYIDMALDGAVIFCRGVTGPVFDLENASDYGTTGSLHSFTFQSIACDGANGGPIADASTSCTGMISQRPQGSPPVNPPTMSAHFDGVHVVNIATVGARGIDVSRMFWILVENSYIGYITNGYGLVCSPTYIPSTTLTVRKTYFHGNLECANIGSNCFGVVFEGVTFESSLIALTRYLQATALRDCWFEAMGDLHGTQTQALSLRSDGSPVDTMIHCDGGAITMDNCTMTAVNDGAGLSGTFRGVGDTSGALAVQGSGGTAWFRNCQSYNSGRVPFFAPGCEITQRGPFDINVDAATNFTANGTVSRGIGARYSDARMISSGIVSVVFSPGSDVRRARVDDGRFCYSGTAPLDVAPLGGNNLRGDRVHVAQPSAGSYSDYVCVADGTAQDSYVGTWKGVGMVQA
jgi:hypothetical protein